ncbi:Phosphoribosylamine--glycine ligase [Porphyridium purpureum]|uniref:phosphoribosylamine--glycine ligase n=1 Tax=Porphyridium purpureum TaxID=35688 RepID=A0A5J4YWF0_PORPP|nr:Phosphoribosylamine--glycine ligase [Porphyridium purpureum]|eukprot:POR7945..scf209_3
MWAAVCFTEVGGWVLGAPGRSAFTRVAIDGHAPRSPCRQRARRRARLVLAAADATNLAQKSLSVLVVGSGGREHALVRAVKKSPFLKDLYAAPGNPGIEADGATLCADVGAEDVDALVACAKEKQVDFVIVGPEVALVKGLVDRLLDERIVAFGPTQAAAVLEGSKVFTKEFMVRHSIPTAWYAKFDGADAAAAAKQFVREKGLPIVIKADGLAAGKGVILAHTVEQADAAIDDILVKQVFGDAGSSMVIEEFLFGEEASFFAILDGENAVALASAQDHKARDDGDKGPNTGGMGAYSPAPVLTAEMQAAVMTDVVLPTARGMVKEGRSFRGVLFVGLMITSEGPKVLEYNVRFGDPECQVLCSRIQSDMLQLLYAASTGKLKEVGDIIWEPYKALVVVMATKGYPGSYTKGSKISGLHAVDKMDKVKVFHAGTARNSDGAIVANGGRVLGVTALGNSTFEAQQRAYAAVDAIDWSEGFCRRDIGWRAVKREEEEKAVPQ